jgi:hypothetical protein
MGGGQRQAHYSPGRLAVTLHESHGLVLRVREGEDGPAPILPPHLAEGSAPSSASAAGEGAAEAEAGGSAEQELLDEEEAAEGEEGSDLEHAQHPPGQQQQQQMLLLPESGLDLDYFDSLSGIAHGTADPELDSRAGGSPRALSHDDGLAGLGGAAGEAAAPGSGGGGGGHGGGSAVLVLKLIGTSTKCDSKAYTVYRLEAVSAHERVVLLRRYSSFVMLHKALCRAFPAYNLGRRWDVRFLAAKASLGEARLGAAVVQSRLALLREYLAELMLLPHVPLSAPMGSFLGLQLSPDGAGTLRLQPFLPGSAAAAAALAEATAAAHEDASRSFSLRSDDEPAQSGVSAADGLASERFADDTVGATARSPDSAGLGGGAAGGGRPGRRIKLLIDVPAPKQPDVEILAAQNGQCAGCGTLLAAPEPPFLASLGAGPGSSATLFLRGGGRHPAQQGSSSRSSMLSSLSASLSSGTAAMRRASVSGTVATAASTVSTLARTAKSRIDLASASASGRMRYCNYTCQLYCGLCHAGAERVIPARLVHRWDEKPAKVRRCSHTPGARRAGHPGRRTACGSRPAGGPCEAPSVDGDPQGSPGRRARGVADSLLSCALCPRALLLRLLLLLLLLPGACLPAATARAAVAPSAVRCLRCANGRASSCR